jgi:hypothetical protein
MALLFYFNLKRRFQMKKLILLTITMIFFISTLGTITFAWFSVSDTANLNEVSNSVIDSGEGNFEIIGDDLEDYFLVPNGKLNASPSNSVEEIILERTILFDSIENTKLTILINELKLDNDLILGEEYLNIDINFNNTGWNSITNEGIDYFPSNTTLDIEFRITINDPNWEDYEKVIFKDISFIIEYIIEVI